PKTVEQKVAAYGGSLETWLQQRFRDNIGYDRLARAVVTFTVRGKPGKEDLADVGLMNFYDANEQKGENLAASTSRIFLGVKLECAQCHDHPFAKYTRRQFWEFAAFFVQADRSLRRGPGVGGPEAELTIPGTENVVQAGVFAGKMQALKQDVDPRV